MRFQTSSLSRKTCGVRLNVLHFDLMNKKCWATLTTLCCFCSWHLAENNAVNADGMPRWCWMTLCGHSERFRPEQVSNGDLGVLWCFTCPSVLFKAIKILETHETRCLPAALFDRSIRQVLCWLVNYSQNIQLINKANTGLSSNYNVNRWLFKSQSGSSPLFAQ